ncbi:MAG: PQQ-binding-like beta-propeller repeat protein [Haloarculaceae archaeon]
MTERDADGIVTRREYLRRAAVGALAGLAGCPGVGSNGGTTPTEATTATGTFPSTDTPASADTATPTATPTDAPTPTATPTDTPAPTATGRPAVPSGVEGTVEAYRYGESRRAFASGSAGPAEKPAVAAAWTLPDAVYQPVVDGSTVYLAYRQRGGGAPTVEARDLRSDEPLWGADLGGRAGAAPTLADGALFVQTDRGVHRVTRGGRTGWTRTGVGTTGFAPTVAGDRVFALGATGLVAFGLGGARQWGIPLSYRALASAAATPDRLYLVLPRDGEGFDLLALETRDGDTAWRARVPVTLGNPPVVTDGRVYVASAGDPGRVTALAADDGSDLWTADARLTSSPAVTDDAVVVAGGGTVTALAPDGTEAWSRFVGDAVVAGPVAGVERVYVGTEADDGTGRLHALDADGGDLRWTVATQAPVLELPAVLDGGVLVVTRAGGTATLSALVDE